MTAADDIGPGRLRDVVGRLDAREIADALWLARLMTNVPPTVSSTSGARSADEKPAGTLGDQKPPTSVSCTDSQPSEQREASPEDVVETGLHVDGPETAGAGSLPARGIRLARESALRDRLGLARAFRPLKQSIAMPSRQALDEHRTAEISAETQMLTLALRSDTERRFDLALVIDASQSMGVWHDAVQELKDLLEKQGAFRDVRSWSFNSDYRDPVLTTYGRRTWSPDAPAHSNSSTQGLVEAAGRRIVLVVTDGIGTAWRGESMSSLLRRWGKAGPLAIVQVLPQRLWRDTSLKPWPAMLAAAPPGHSRPRIIPEWSADPAVHSGVSERAGERGSGWLPVLGLSRQSLEPWTAAVAGRLPGVRPVAALPLPAVGRFGGGLSHQDESYDRAPKSAESAWDIVRRFRIQASPLAFDLAGYLAAAPLTLPVMRVVQGALVPNSRPDHLAELFLYGLLTRSPKSGLGEHADQVLYDFPPGVRENLLSTRTRSDAYNVLDELSRVSRRLSPRFGANLDFRALIPSNESAATSAIPEGSRPFAFAQVAVTVLGGLGGKYEDLAQRITPLLEPVDLPALQVSSRAKPIALQSRRPKSPTSGPSSGAVHQIAQIGTSPALSESDSTTKSPPHYIIENSRETAPNTPLKVPKLHYPDPTRSRAILIGTSEYENYGPLPAVANNLNKLHDIFTDAEYGGFLPENCHVIHNPQDPGILARHIRDVANDAIDTLFIYCSGHGAISSDSDEPSLFLRYTKSSDLYYAAFPISMIQHAIKSSPAATKIFVLECSWSGQVAAGALTGIDDDTLQEIVKMDGVYTLTASTADEVPVAPADGTYTAFSEAFIRILKSPLEDYPAGVTMTQLHSLIYRDLQSRGYPVPRQSAVNSGGDLALIAWNANTPRPQNNASQIPLSPAAGKSGNPVTRAPELSRRVEQFEPEFGRGPGKIDQRLVGLLRQVREQDERIPAGTQEPRFPDPDRSRAILIGTAEYAGGQPSAVANLHRLREVFTDAERGGFSFDDCHVIDNPQDPRALSEHVKDFAGEATDVLLVYCSGHGIIDLRRNELQLVLKHAEVSDIHHTAIPVSLIQEAIKDSPAAVKIFIFECSWAGQAVVGTVVDADSNRLQAQAEMEGVYTLTASAVDKSPPLLTDATYTAFSEALIRILESPVGEYPAGVTLTQLYPLISEDLRSQGYPIPKQSATNRAGDLALVGWDLGRDAREKSTAIDSIVTEMIRISGPTHPYVLYARDIQCYWWVKAGRIKEAKDLLWRILTARTGILGSDHPEVLNTRQYFAHITGLTGDHAGAAAQFRQLWSDRERVNGPNHPDTQIAIDFLACWTGINGNLDEAVELYQKLNDEHSWMYGPTDARTLDTKEKLGDWQSRAGKNDLARNTFDQLMYNWSTIEGPQSRNAERARRKRDHQAAGGDGLDSDFSGGDSYPQQLDQVFTPSAAVPRFSQ